MHTVGARGCTAVVACMDRSQQAQLRLHTVHIKAARFPGPFSVPAERTENVSPSFLILSI